MHVRVIKSIEDLTTQICLEEKYCFKNKAFYVHIIKNIPNSLIIIDW